MLDFLTIYTALGMFAGIIGFGLLFKKWDLPSKIKNGLRLDNRLKVVLFSLFAGIVLAFLLSLFTVLLQLPAWAGEAMEGLAIGFICSMLVRFFQLITPGSGSARAGSGKKTVRTAQSKGRRSKG